MHRGGEVRRPRHRDEAALCARELALLELQLYPVPCTLCARERALLELLQSICGHRPPSGRRRWWANGLARVEQCERRCQWRC